MRCLRIILLTLLISITTTCTAYAFEHRLNQDGIQRIFQYGRLFEYYSHKYNIPLHILFGIAYNESNGHAHVIGDAGYAFSLNQIRCSEDGKRFSWLPYLKKRGLKLRRCKDLLDPETNIKAACEILIYHYEKYNNWQDTVKAYHLGYRWKYHPRRVNRYYKKVTWFGLALIREWTFVSAFHRLRQYIMKVAVKTYINSLHVRLL